MDIINDEKKSFIINNNKRLYPTIFKWEGQEEIVYLTGSFCDWLKFYEMEKIGNIFYYTLFFRKELININSRSIQTGNIIQIFLHVVIKKEILII